MIAIKRARERFGSNLGFRQRVQRPPEFRRDDLRAADRRRRAASERERAVVGSMYRPEMKGRST